VGFAILRSALGLQQVPPPAVTMGLALIMSIYVMSPVGSQVYDAVEPMFSQPSGQDIVSGGGAQMILNVVDKAREPLKTFLAKHAHRKERALFHQMALRMGPPKWKERTKGGDVLALLLDFTVRD